MFTSLIAREDSARLISALVRIAEHYTTRANLSCLPHGEGDRVPGHTADQDAVIYGHPCHGGQVELHGVAD